MKISNIKYIFVFFDKYIKKYRIYLVIGFLLTIVYSLLSLISPIITKVVINNIILDRNSLYINKIIIAVITLVFLMSFFGFL